MATPNSAVTLTADQIDFLNRMLSALRHDVNGKSSLIVAGAELMRLGRDVDKHLRHLSEQPALSLGLIGEFDRVLAWTLGAHPGTSRPPAPLLERSAASVSKRAQHRPLKLRQAPLLLQGEDITHLRGQFALMRDNVTNCLSLIVAAADLIEFNPETTERMISSLLEQPARIAEELGEFGVEFDRVLGIVRG